MLVLSRHEGESILIMPNIKVTVVETQPGRVRIGIDAPEEVIVLREEVFQRMEGRIDEWKRKRA